MHLWSEFPLTLLAAQAVPLPRKRREGQNEGMLPFSPLAWEKGSGVEGFLSTLNVVPFFSLLGGLGDLAVQSLFLAFDFDLL